MNHPKVSICIPTYKQPELVRRCLVSIEKQNYTNYEVVVTDDTPDNEVEEIIYGFKDRIKNLKYYRNETRKGSPENWNECVDKSNGEYIKMMHHDDWFTDEMSLIRYVELLENNPKADFAFSSSNSCGINNEIISVHLAGKQQILDLKTNFEMLFLCNIIGAPSATIYRKKLNLKYDTNLMWLVDVDFYIRLLSINSNFSYCDEPIINVTMGGDYQITKQCENNKDIILFESVYQYGKIKNKITKIKYLRILLYQFYKYNLFSVDGIPNKEKIKMLPEIRMLIIFNKIFSFINGRYKNI